MSELTPREIVNELDRYIIGQHDAKRAVAMALRNRWRRMQLEPGMREEVTPKNILMIGPTGVGKTEIARRLATLANAPFVKVEATKFTEVGYVGKDVESIIRDLADVRLQADPRAGGQARAHAGRGSRRGPHPRRAAAAPADADRLEPGRAPRRAIDSDTRQKLRKQLREGALDEREIELDFADATSAWRSCRRRAWRKWVRSCARCSRTSAAARRSSASWRSRLARPLLIDEEAGKLLNDDELRAQAMESAEQNGIVFIDEIDKVAQRSDHGHAGVSREGVQRDLLPLVEGSTVSTKYGPIKTDHMLFIASGAFSLAKPSDLIPELQGRLPIRVELSALSVDDFMRILREPHNALTKQYIALLATEGVGAGVHRLRHRPAGRGGVPGERAHREHRRAPAAHRDGAPAGDRSPTRRRTNPAKTTVSTPNMSTKHSADLVQNEDLSRYIL